MPKLQGNPFEHGDILVESELDSKKKIKRPSMYKVIILNDDYTPMDFVVHILKSVFSKSDSEAVAIMLQVHERGAGLAGVYSLDIAEMKVITVDKEARKNNHPLKCTLEKEDSNAE